MTEADAKAMLLDSIDNFDPSALLGTSEEFQQVANGLFQAEGSITARLRGSAVKPLLSLGQALSPESLLFFTRLWFAVGKAGTLHLVLSDNGR